MSAKTDWNWREHTHSFSRVEALRPNDDIFKLTEALGYATGDEYEHPPATWTDAVGPQDVQLCEACRALTRSLVTSTALEKALLIPTLCTDFTHANVPHERFLRGQYTFSHAFRRVLLITTNYPTTWLDRLEDLADAFGISFSFDPPPSSPNASTQTTVSFGCKCTLHAIDSDAVRPTTLREIQNYLGAADSWTMLPTGGWRIQGFGPTYRARLEHASFRLFCMILNALSHSESPLGKLMRRSEYWQEEAKGWWSFDPYVPAFGMRNPFTPMGIRYTSDEAQVDFWLADTISQTLVISSIQGPAVDPQGRVRPGRYIFVFQAHRSMLVIQDQRAVRDSRLLRFVLTSSAVTKIVCSSEHASRLQTILSLPISGDWMSGFYDISDFIPFIASPSSRQGSLRALHDLIGYREELGGRFTGDAWWRTAIAQHNRDPQYEASIISDTLWCLGIREPAHYLRCFDRHVSTPTAATYPVIELHTYQLLYRGGDGSPHHSACTCPMCQTPTSYHCTASGSITAMAKPKPPLWPNCLCTLHYTRCRCYVRAGTWAGLSPNAAPWVPKEEETQDYRNLADAINSGRAAPLPFTVLTTSRQAVREVQLFTNLPNDVLIIILRRLAAASLFGSINLLESSKAIRKYARSACYELYLARCVCDFFMIPKPLQHSTPDRRGERFLVRHITFSLLHDIEPPILHPTTILAPPDGRYDWASKNSLAVDLSKSTIRTVTPGGLPYATTVIDYEWIRIHAADWLPHINISHRRPANLPGELIGTILVAARLLPYAGHRVVSALVCRFNEPRATHGSANLVHVGQDITHARHLRVLAPTGVNRSPLARRHDEWTSIFLHRVGSLRLVPAHEYAGFDTFHALTMAIRNDFDGFMPNPAIVLRQAASPTAARSRATMMVISLSTPDRPAPLHHSVRLLDSSHYSTGMHISAAVYYSQLLVRVWPRFLLAQVVETINNEQILPDVDEYLILECEAKVSDLYSRVRKLYRAYLESPLLPNPIENPMELYLTHHAPDGTADDIFNTDTRIQDLPYYTHGMNCSVTVGEPGFTGSQQETPSDDDSEQGQTPTPSASSASQREPTLQGDGMPTLPTQQTSQYEQITAPTQYNTKSAVRGYSNSNGSYYSRPKPLLGLIDLEQSHPEPHPPSPLRLRGGGSKSKGTTTRASKTGSFLSLGTPEATAAAPIEPTATTPRPATGDPVDPTTLPPLIEIGASSSTTALPDYDPFIGAPSPIAPPVTVPPPEFGAAPIAPPVIVPPPEFGAAPMPPHVADVAYASAAILDELRESSVQHRLTLSTLTFDLSAHIDHSREVTFTLRDSLDRIALDLKASDTDRRAQREEADRTARENRDTTARLALDLRDEMRLFIEAIKPRFPDGLPQPALLSAETDPTAGGTEPGVYRLTHAIQPRYADAETDPTAGGTEPGASRFTHVPFGRGRPLRDTSRQTSKLPHPCHPASASSSSGALEQPSHRTAGSSDLAPTRTTPQVKRHTTYGRKIDVASVPDSKKYAIVAVVNVNGITTVCATEQFRTWTITQPQSTTVTIETAIWSLLRVGILDAQDIFAEFDPVFCDFRFRIGYGETTDDTLDGILRLTFPDSRDTDPQTSVNGVAQTFQDLDFYDVITTYVQSNAAVKAANNAHLAPIEMPIRTIERNELRRTLAAALMCHPYSEDVRTPHHPRLGDTSTDQQERSPPEHRRTLWNRLPQMDVAAALPHWTADLSIQAFQQLLITTIHTDTASLVADLLVGEQDPLQTILAAILRRHHDSAEFTMLVTADIAEHLKDELVFYKNHYASAVSDAQLNYTDARHHRSFLSVLCVCLAAIRSAFLGTSRDGALHSEARQLLTQLAIMPSNSDVEYLLEANAYWLRYSKLWGPVLLLSLCDGGQIQTLLPSVTSRLSPPMQERILLFFGEIAHRLRVTNDAGNLPAAFASQLSSILKKPLLLHSTIPALHTYAEFSGQSAVLKAMHLTDMTLGSHTHRIAHPADLAFVGKTGALADYWPAMMRQLLGHHNRVLVAPAAQIALVAWDDIQSTEPDDVLLVADAPRFRPGPKTIIRQHDRLASAADTQFTKLEANVNKAHSQIETKVNSLQSSIESTLEAKVNSLQVNIEKHLGTIQGTIMKVSKDLGSRLDQHDASMAAFHDLNAHNAQTMQHCLRNVADSTTELKHAATIRDAAAAIGKHARAPVIHLPPVSAAPVRTTLLHVQDTQDDPTDAIAHQFAIACETHEVTSLDDLLAWVETDGQPEPSELFALTFNRRPAPTAPQGTYKLSKWPALKFDDLTDAAKTLYLKRDNVTSAESYLSATNRLCTNCAPESRLMPHLESRCPTIYRHTSQGRKDRDAVRLARDAERLNELQSTTAT